MQMSKTISISAAAKLLGVVPCTLRRWEASGKIMPTRTKGGARRYDVATLTGQLPSPEIKLRKTVAYARVSSHGQKDDLVRQQQLLELYCSSRGWSFDLVSDLGSGLNYRKKGLQRLLTEILAGEIGRLVLTHKDRLLRFGAELVFSICEAKNVEVVIINQGADTSFEEDLARDVLEIITVFSARLYGRHSRKNAQVVDALKQAMSAPAA